MRGVNKVILVGNLGRDPEVKYLSGGSAVATFSIATSEGWKDKQTGEPMESVEWHNIKAFGKLAEICGQYLKKGAQVFITGKIKTERWEKDGEQKSKVLVYADEMQMLGGAPPRQAGDRPADSKPQSHRDGGAPGPRQTPPPDDFEDVPF